MTKVSCVSRAKCTAWKMDSESDLDEWLCGVELAGNVTISKSKNNGVTVADRNFKLNFHWGDWIVTDEREMQFKSFNDDDFKSAFEIN